MNNGETWSWPVSSLLVEWHARWPIPPPPPPTPSPTCHYFVPWRLWTSTHSGHQQLSSDFYTVWAWEFIFSKKGQKLTTDVLIKLWGVAGLLALSTSSCCLRLSRVWFLVTTVEASSPCLQHRTNMELDLQSLFGLHVHCAQTHWLRPRNPLPIPPHLGSYTRALLVRSAKIGDISLWPPG